MRAFRLSFLLGMLSLGLLVAPALAAASTFENTPTGTWMVNGPVRAFAQDGNILWIGGQFTQLSDKPPNKAGATVIPVHNLVALDARTGTPIQGLHVPDITGTIVYALTVADGQLFIGGNFTAVDGTARQNIASVDPQTGSLNAFKETMGTVWTMTADSTKLYVGGGFTKVGKVARTRMAAFGFDGTLDPNFAPRLDNTARDLSISPDGQSIYVVGQFKNAAGPDGVYSSRNSAAKFDTNTGLLDPWQMTGPVSTELYGIGVQAIGDRVYVGMGGSDWAAAFTDTDGTQLWRTDTFGQVQDIAVLDDRLIIAGHFSWVAPAPGGAYVCTKNGGNGCLPRQKMAALDLNGTLDQSWDPESTGEYPGVWRVHVDGHNLWTGGAFNGVGGSIQQKIAFFQDKQPGDPVFDDGFESGYMSAWNLGNFGLTVTQSDALTGQSAAEASTTGPTRYAYELISPTPSDVWYRINFKVNSRSTAATLLSLRQPGGTEIYRVFLGATGKLSGLVGGATKTSTVIPANNAWHELRIHLDSGAGTAQVELDGVDVSALDVSGSLAAAGRFQLGDTVANRSYDILYDDVDVSASP